MTDSFNPKLPIQTRDGRKARILAADIKGAVRPIVAAIQVDKISGDEAVHFYSSNGRAIFGMDTPHDLVNIDEFAKPGRIMARTTNGRRVWLYTTEAPGLYPYVGTVEDGSNSQIYVWNQNGRSATTSRRCDLVLDSISVCPNQG